MVCLPCRMPWCFACVLPTHALPGMRKLLPTAMLALLALLPRYMPTPSTTLRGSPPSGVSHPPGFSTALRGLLPPSGGFHPPGIRFLFFLPSPSPGLPRPLERSLLSSFSSPSLGLPRPPSFAPPYHFLLFFRSGGHTARLPWCFGTIHRESFGVAVAAHFNSGDVAQGVVPMPVFRGKGKILDSHGRNTIAIAVPGWGCVLSIKIRGELEKLVVIGPKGSFEPASLLSVTNPAQS
jgi:hypothetical protein